jgi:hypothetical protein
MMVSSTWETRQPTEQSREIAAKYSPLVRTSSHTALIAKPFDPTLERIHHPFHPN